MTPRLPLLGSFALASLSFLAPTFAQNSAADPASTSEATHAVESAHTDAKGRHLAPHGTFYLLSYVAVKTANGVDGFDPGTKVTLVEVHRPTRTLVVTDGHAQVEVPPSQLTNDLDVAAVVRGKDEASQARVAAYIQSEQVAYNKYEREAADYTAKDLEHARDVQQQQAAETRKEEQAPVAQTAEPAYASYNGNGNGYYGDEGYGFGSPYSFFVTGSNAGGRPAASAPAAARGSNPAATSGTSAVAPAAAPAAVGHAK